MLKNLKKLLESEKKDNTIFDIIIYGSFVKGKQKSNDIDIAVIFLSGTLRERLDKIQNIKTKLNNITIKIDIKQILLKELFDPAFFNRTGIINEGISIFKNMKFCETLGYKACTLFWYNLKGLKHKDKVKFNYILAGRNTKGILEEFNGMRLANGAVKIPVENSIAFEDILKANNVKFDKSNILEEI